MKIKGEIIEVSDAGDSIKVTAQCRALKSNEFSPWLSVAINVPHNSRNSRAFYIGREITVTVKPS